MAPTQLLPRVHVGAPIHRDALTLFPLWTEHPEVQPTYRPADDLPGAVTVGEMPEPDVPHLLVTNGSNQAALLLEGELVAGGLQHRTLNLTILLPAGARTPVPVSCVEHGRWGDRADSKFAGRHAAPSVRRRKTASVAHAMRKGERWSDQSGVWEEVASRATAMDAAPPTGSLLDVDDLARPAVEVLTDDLRPLPGQRGMIVGIGGEVRALELFDSAEVFAHYFERLVDGFATEAIDVPATPTSSSAARKFIRSLQHVQVHESPAVGLGTEISGTTEHLALLGLRLDEQATPVHLAAFAA